MCKGHPLFFYGKEYIMLSGDKLKFLRYTMGKTQKEIAEWCNVSVRYIGMVEKGEESLSEETYKAWLNCIYDTGKPLPKTPRYNQTAKKKKLVDKE